MRRQELLRSCGEGPAQVLQSTLEQLPGSRHGNQTVVQVHRRAAPGASLPSIRVVQKKSQRARVVLAGLVVAAAVATVVAVSGGDSSDTRPRCGTNDPDTDWGVGVWPTGCWRPYADDSPFNQRLPSDPRLDPRSEQIVARFAEGGGPSDLRAGIADTSSDYQHPTYWSEKDDPEFEITCTREFGRCEVEGMRVRIPDLARPAAGSDRHLTVVDQDSGWEYDFWEVNSKPKGGGVLSVGFGGRTRIDGRRSRLQLHGRPLRKPGRDHPGSGAGARPHRPCPLRDRRLRLGPARVPGAGHGRAMLRPHRRPQRGHPLPARHVRGRDQRARSPPLEARDPPGDGSIRHVRRRHRRITVVPRVRVRLDVYEFRREDPRIVDIARRPASPASGTATTSTWRRTSTGESPARWWIRA